MNRFREKERAFPFYALPFTSVAENKTHVQRIFIVFFSGKTDIYIYMQHTEIHTRVCVRDKFYSYILKCNVYF